MDINNSPYDQTYANRADDILAQNINKPYCQGPSCRTFNSPFFNNIFFNIQNNTYEVSLMWCLLVTTIVLLLSLLIRDADDEAETLRAV